MRFFSHVPRIIQPKKYVPSTKGVPCNLSSRIGPVSLGETFIQANRQTNVQAAEYADRRGSKQEGRKASKQADRQ